MFEQTMEVIDLVSDDEEVLDVPVNKHYWVTVQGTPKAMPRPTFMAWLKRDKLMRRVFNGAAEEIKVFGQEVRKVLATSYSESTFPLIHAGSVQMTIRFYRRIPNSAFKSDKRSRPFKSKSKGGCHPGERAEDLKKPDLDNLVKFVLDALNGIAYTDDAQVTKLEVEKLMDTKPPFNGRTVLTFKKRRSSDF